MADTQSKNLTLFGILMGAVIVATAAMVPALLFLLDPARPTLFSDGPPISPVPFVAAFAVGNTILSAFAIWIGLRLEQSVHMGVPLLRSWVAKESNVGQAIPRILLRCSLLAVTLAAIILATGFMLRMLLPELPDGFVFPPIWQGVMMLLGAAFREEVLFRLFALNVFVWIATKALRRREPGAKIVWASITVVAFIFALMHLAPLTQLLELTELSVAVGLLLSTGAGVLFGWTYWRYGLLIAVVTHAVCNVSLYLGVRAVLAFAV